MVSCQSIPIVRHTDSLGVINHFWIRITRKFYERITDIETKRESREDAQYKNKLNRHFMKERKKNIKDKKKSLE